MEPGNLGTETDERINTRKGTKETLETILQLVNTNATRNTEPPS